MTIASAMAKTGAMLLSAPAIFGPIRRLDSKFSSATVPGKNSPTQANSATAFRLPSLGSTKNRARHQKSSVDVGMLIATPSHGGIQRNPNWVITKPAPNPKVEASARKIAVVIGAFRRGSRSTRQDPWPFGPGQYGSSEPCLRQKLRQAIRRAHAPE